MPVILRWNGYRFLFWSGDKGEPPHIHVKKGQQEVKIWIDTLEVAKSYDLNDYEIRNIVKHVKENKDLLSEKWHEFFTDTL